jgi:ketosteroid isomerase-like protein
MLAELVEVVIGVDTHKHTHPAAVILSATGAVLAERTVSADPAGYTELIALADQHPGPRAWALEGSGGYGAGMATHLADHHELVIELIYTVVITRLRLDPATRDYAERLRLQRSDDRPRRHLIEILRPARVPCGAVTSRRPGEGAWMEKTMDGTAVVEEFLRLMGHGQASCALGLVSDDVTVSEPEGLPHGGEYRGKKAFVEVLRALAANYRLDVADVRVINGGSVIVAMADVQWTSVSTGRSLDTRLCELYTVADGLITSIEVFPKDTRMLHQLTIA